MLPKNLQTITGATVAATEDISPAFPALRTTVLPANVGTEQTLVNVPPTLPAQPDIMTYVADDTFALFYNAFDNDIGYICDYDTDFIAGTKQCAQGNSRSTQLTETGGAGVPVHPATYHQPYAAYQTLRTFDLEVHDDFKALKFAKELRQKLSVTPNALPLYQYVIDPSITHSYLHPPFINRKSNDYCVDELSYLSLLSYVYSESNAVDATSIVFKIGNVDTPNWLNGVILAISKKIYNTIPPVLGKTSAFDPCLTLFPAMTDLTTYLESAACAWDLMDDKFYANGLGARTGRATTTDVITWRSLLDLIIALKPAAGINSLFELVVNGYDDTIKTPVTKQIFINNYLIAPPAAPVDPTLVLFSMLAKSTTSSTTLPTDTKPLLVTDPDEIIPPLVQLLNYPTISPHSIHLLSERQLAQIESSLDKWTTISGINQGLQVLLGDPASQTVDQPIEFINIVNRDIAGSVIDLCYNKLSPHVTRIQVCNPMSLVSLTFFLESAMANEVAVFSVGDMDFYFVHRPWDFNGQVSEGIVGMIIATINNKLCDIRMINSDKLLANDFVDICPRAGPLVTSIYKQAAPTYGNEQIVVYGQRLTQDMSIRIGQSDCFPKQFIDPTMFLCTTQPGVGANLPVTIYIPSSTLFNLQRSKVLFSYDKSFVLYQLALESIIPFKS
eukprot:gene14534-17168_t